MFSLPTSRNDTSSSTSLLHHAATSSSGVVGQSSTTFSFYKKPGAFSDKYVSEWTTNDLVEWAKTYKYEDAPDKFSQNEWDGGSLIYITLQDLMDIGIRKGEAKSIETRIKTLLQRDPLIHITKGDIQFSKDLLFGPNIASEN